MKACIIQPPYSRNVSFSDEYFDYKIKLLDECDESVDIIVLPEYSSSVSFSEDSEICGASMVVSPEGKALEKCPDIARCRGMRGLSLEATREMIDSAVKYKCSKVQFYKPYYNDEFIKEAHEKGLICNVFRSDDPLEAKEMIGSGFDTVLTNEFNLVNNIIKG